MKRVLATVVLGTSLLNRAAIAEQLRVAIQAEHPGGACVIETREEAGSLVPPKGEEWEFMIVMEFSFTSTLRISANRLVLPSLPKDPDDE